MTSFVSSVTSAAPPEPLLGRTLSVALLIERLSDKVRSRTSFPAYDYEQKPFLQKWCRLKRVAEDGSPEERADALQEMADMLDGKVI